MATSIGFAADLFDGQTIVVTGANRGIGLAIVEGFKSCGGRVIAHGGRRGSRRLAELADICVTADFARRDEIDRFVGPILDSESKIDVLINNAGTMLGRFPADAVSDAQYRSIVDINQSSVVQVTRDLIPLLRKSKGGAIVNTTSISALTGGSPGSSIYSSAKAFVATYTKALARELAGDNIRANAVSPGTILTDFHRRYSSEEKLEKTRKSIPLGRLGEPGDCAAAFLFLASRKLAGYITGQTLEVNGGQLIV